MTNNVRLSAFLTQGKASTVVGVGVTVVVVIIVAVVVVVESSSVVKLSFSVRFKGGNISIILLGNPPMKSSIIFSNLAP
ncbi:hypothetical protein Tco_0804083 [Tanacetum coccineum]|uniref:Transmembrane protein n=1 Tax=Tanacetum coccineum TaxID=301880 RepID=A0ABQ5A494_9ASTR